MFKAFLSPLPPAELLGKVREIADPDDLAPESRDLFAGARDVVGRVSANRFVLRRRPAQPWGLWLLNPASWFWPTLTGTVHARAEGSELMVEGGAPIVAKLLWFLVFAGVAAVGGVVTVFSLPVTLNYDAAHSAAKFLTGLVVTGLLQGLLVLPPALAWWFTRGHLAYLAERLRRELSLQEIGFKQLAPE